MYRFLFTIVFFGKRKNNTHKTFCILRMKAHFENEPHFKNKSSFRNPIWKWKQSTIFRPSYGPEKALRVMDDRLQHHGYQFARCTPLNFVLTTSWKVLLSSIFQVFRAYVVLHNMRTKGPFIYNLFFTCLYPSKTVSSCSSRMCFFTFSQNNKNIAKPSCLLLYQYSEQLLILVQFSSHLLVISSNLALWNGSSVLDYS